MKVLFIDKYGDPEGLDPKDLERILAEIAMERAEEFKEGIGGEESTAKWSMLIYRITLEEIDMFDELEIPVQGIRTSEIILMDLEETDREVFAEELVEYNPTLELPWDRYLLIGQRADKLISVDGRRGTAIDHLYRVKGIVEDLLSSMGQDV